MFCKTLQSSNESICDESLFLEVVSPHTCSCTKRDAITGVFQWIYLLAEKSICWKFDQGHTKKHLLKIWRQKSCDTRIAGSLCLIQHIRQAHVKDALMILMVLPLIMILVTIMIIMIIIAILIVKITILIKAIYIFVTVNSFLVSCDTKHEGSVCRSAITCQCVCDSTTEYRRTKSSKGFERKPFQVFHSIKNHWVFKITHESLLGEPLQVALIEIAQWKYHEDMQGLQSYAE